MNTIHEVAKAAGVSISTVSYALSGKRSVSPSTRKRITEIAEELNYRPNARAKALASQRTSILAVTEPLRASTSAPAHMAFVMAVAAAARRANYDVLLLTQEEAAGGLERVTATGMVDGIIILDVLKQDERAELARSLEVPSILVGVPDDPSGLTCVDMDFEAAGRMAVDRLADAGHAHIGFLGHPEASYVGNGSNFPPRLRKGIWDQAKTRAVTVTTTTPERETAGVEQALSALLDGDSPATALVLHCDEEAHELVLAGLAERNLTVPDDVALISAASTFDTQRFHPALDVIPLIPERSCDRAVELALQRLATEADVLAATPPPKEHLELMEPTYVAHGSVTPAHP